MVPLYSERLKILLVAIGMVVAVILLLDKTGGTACDKQLIQKHENSKDGDYKNEDLVLSADSRTELYREMGWQEGVYNAEEAELLRLYLSVGEAYDDIHGITQSVRQHINAIRPLTEVMLNNSDSEMRDCAAMSLMALGETAARPVYLAILNNTDYRDQAIGGLFNCGDTVLALNETYKDIMAGREVVYSRDREYALCMLRVLRDSTNYRVRAWVAWMLTYGFSNLTDAEETVIRKSVGEIARDLELGKIDGDTTIIRQNIEEYYEFYRRYKQKLGIDG